MSNLTLLNKHKKNNELNFQKPLSLIHVTRHELNPFQAKALNYFVYLHVTNKYLNNNNNYNPSPELLPLFGEEQKKGEYLIRFSDLTKTLKINTRNKAHLVKEIEGLACTGMKYKEVEINDEKNTHKFTRSGSMSYLDTIDIKGEYISYTLGNKYQVHIDELISNSSTRYAYLNLGLISQLRSKYAIALYEILNGHSDGRFPKIKLTLFSELMGFPKEYLLDVYKLKEKVIKPAVRELNETREMIVTYDIFEESGIKLIKFNKKSCIIDVQQPNKDFFLWLTNKKNPDAKNKEAYANKLRQEYEAGNLQDFDNFKTQYDEELNPELLTFDYIIKKELNVPISEIYIQMKGKYYEKYETLRSKLGQETIKKLENKLIDDYKANRVLSSTIATKKQVSEFEKEQREIFKTMLKEALSGSEMDYANYTINYVNDGKKISEPIMITKGSVSFLNIKALKSAEYLFNLSSYSGSIYFTNTNLQINLVVLDMNSERCVLRLQICDCGVDND
ncbi:MAG: replication initiation protein [Arcobacteraceae bacterium]